MSRFIASPIAQLIAAIVLIGLAIVAAVRGEAAAGVAFVGLAVAIPCTVLANHLRKEPRR